MKVTDKKVVELVYELKVNGELVEKVEKENPLQFISGIGAMLPKFESNINGLEVGDKFDFKLVSEDAYGKKQDNLIVDLHKDVFKIDGVFDESLLVVGRVIPMADQEGRRLNGKVLEVENDNVKLDFNHPLADQDLSFKGSIVSIREATDEEIAHGHVHCHGGGHDGGCGSCGCH